MDKTVYYERFWDCSCGRKGISALRYRKCPGCGQSKTNQDSEHRSRVEITDPDGLALAKGGPHWVCSNCFSVMLDKYEECTQCGNPKDKSDHVNEVRKLDSLPPSDYKPQGDEQFYNPGAYSKEEVPVSVPDTSYVPAEDTHFTERENNSSSWFNKTNLMYAGIAFIVVAALAILGYLFFNTKSVEAPVSGFSWTRDVTIERYQTVHHTGESSYPADAYNVNSYQVSRQVPVYRSETTTRDCSYDTESCTDNGNGSDSCTTQHHSQTCSDTKQVLDHYDTVYDTKYDYDRDEWIYERTEHSQGNDRNPYWPEFTLTQDSQNVLGAERVGGRTEVYTVYFDVPEKDTIKTYSVGASQDEWLQYKEGASYTLKINHFGMVVNNPYEDKLKDK